MPPKGPPAEAIGYTIDHWTALTRNLEDGRLEIDNNAVERAMRKRGEVILPRSGWNDPEGCQASAATACVA